MTAARRALQDERGSTTVEFALFSTVFMMLLLGICYYGLYLWSANALQQTAARTARCMGVLQSDCSASRVYSSTNTTSFAQSVAAGYGLTLPAADVALNNANSCGGQGSDNSSVTLTYPFSGGSGGLLPGIGSTTLTAKACFPNQS